MRDNAISDDLECDWSVAPGMEEPLLRRPGDDIPNRPHLKVKQIVDNAEETAAEGQAPVRGEPDQPDAPEAKVRKTICLPPRKQRDAMLAFATHRDAPGNTSAERRQLAGVNGKTSERELSAGFVLGVVLIVLALVGGVLVAGLRSRVTSLEQRVASLEVERGEAGAAR